MVVSHEPYVKLVIGFLFTSLAFMVKTFLFNILGIKKKGWNYKSSLVRCQCCSDPNL